MGWQTSTPTSSTYVNNTSFEGNANAGVRASAGVQDITNSSAQGNTEGFFASGGIMTLTGTHVFGNIYGLVVNSGSITFSYSVISGNGTTCLNTGGAIQGSNPGTSIVSGACSLTGTATLQ